MWYDVIGVIYRLIIIFLIPPPKKTNNGVTPRLIPRLPLPLLLWMIYPPMNDGSKSRHK